MQVLYTLRTSPGPRQRPVFADMVREQLPEAPYQVANRASLELVDYGLVQLPDDFCHPPTEVLFNELNCLTAGQGEVAYGGRRFPVRPGNVYLFPAGKTLGSANNHGVRKGYCHFSLRLHGFDPVSYTHLNCRQGSLSWRRASMGPDWNILICTA